MGLIVAMTLDQPDDLIPSGAPNATKPAPRLHGHYGAFAGICLYIGLWGIVQSIRGAAGAGEPFLPAEPARRDGALLTTIPIVVTSFTVASYFYLKRPKSPLRWLACRANAMH